MSAVVELGRRRADTGVVTSSMPVGYLPRHCAGTTCLHDHHGDSRPAMGFFRSVLERAREGCRQEPTSPLPTKESNR